MARGDVQLVNPAQKWLKWSGSTGTLSFYNKETKENVEVKTPFTFLLLETYTTVKGYNESLKEGIYANEVKDTTKQLLTVKSGKEVIAKGLYKDIKATVVTAGGGYAQSCYIAYKGEDGKLAIGNIMMAGSSFGGGTHQPIDKNMKDIVIGGWLDFNKKYSNEVLTKAVVLEGKDDRICTQGATKFYVPKFKLVDVSPETDKEAIELTQVLKAYMTEYFKKTQSEETEQEVAAKVEESLKKQFGGTTAELTESEKVFMVKHEPEEVQENLGGPLPGEEDFDPFDPNEDGLPF